MNRNIFITFFSCVLLSFKLLAQTDDYTGTWQMRTAATARTSSINIELQIAAPEKNILYPAQLKLQCDSFNAVYEILLVRKNLRQLGISRNKFPISEDPFSIGEWTIAFNGTFDYSRDIKAEPMLTINRLPAKRYGITLPDFMNFTETRKKIAMQLSSFLKDQEIVLKKINSLPWQNQDADKILTPRLSPAYFGLIDTIHLQTRDGVINFSGNKRTGNDIITVVLNGKTILDQIDPGKKKPPEEILLDTGLNILTLFADIFNKASPNKAKINAEFGNKKFKLDFTNKPDIAATFIVAKLYYDKGKDAYTHFQNFDMNDPNQKSLSRNEKLIGSIVANTQQITLALWDDAVEDGDSVSININGRWIVRGFPVKKNPQFIRVTLAPGPNTITFVADNLGSIPPNTSVLEIIDGKKRKSFSIETNLDQNNLIKIFYDYKPGD
ncbi:MAG: hypothetical protein ABI741_13200 [Ferruginibacter sp.]